ncbi:MAG TPA: cupredoxin domain-containing protein [Rhodopila sp.]|nr:cupredoxin domain-containing protein [Rhodopila sp.]
MRTHLPLLLSLTCLAWAGAARADAPVVHLTLQGHRFVPAEITIPANTKVELVVKNADPTSAEFESSDLNREKVVTAGRELHLWIGPLSPGRYQFFDDFHPATQGTLIAQ